LANGLGTGKQISILKYFWLRTKKKGVLLIIMIMKLVEDGKIKGDRYWPDNENDFITKDFRVKLISQQCHPSNNHIFIRDLELINLSTEKSIYLKHIHFLGWPDFGVPNDTTSIRELVKLMKTIESSITLVHCSAGIGRTGTFISIAIGIEMLYNTMSEGSNENDIDVENLVLNLRKQRNKGMVQNLQQYQYIYNVLNEEKQEIIKSRKYHYHKVYSDEENKNSNDSL